MSAFDSSPPRSLSQPRPSSSPARRGRRPRQRGATGRFSILIVPGVLFAGAIFAIPAAAEVTRSGILGAGGTARLIDGRVYADIFYVEIERGEPLHVELTSAEFDTYLVVVSPSGKATKSDDYEGSTTRSRIELTASESGRWHIIATSFGPRESGPYRLSVWTDQALAAAAPTFEILPEWTARRGTEALAAAGAAAAEQDSEAAEPAAAGSAAAEEPVSRPPRRAGAVIGGGPLAIEDPSPDLGSRVGANRGRPIASGAVAASCNIGASAGTALRVRIVIDRNFAGRPDSPEPGHRQSRLQRAEFDGCRRSHGHPPRAEPVFDDRSVAGFDGCSRGGAGEC